MLPISYHYNTKIIVTREDLMQYESLICNSFAKFLKFESSSLRFPNNFKNMQSNYDNICFKNDRIYIPLVFDTILLGTFVAKINEENKLSEQYLKSISELIMDKIFLHKASTCDLLTGLHNQHYLHKYIEQELEPTLPENTKYFNSADKSLFPTNSVFGFLLLDLDNFKHINTKYGYEFGNKILQYVAEIILHECSTESLVTRLEEETFGIFLSTAANKKCINTANDLIRAIAAARFEYPMSQERISLTVSIGIFLHPQDIHGAEILLPSAEKSALILDKTRRSVKVAKNFGGNQFCFYNNIKIQGGMILKHAPFERFFINIGEKDGVNCGDLFSVWGINETNKQSFEVRKGEVVVIETDHEQALVEILSINDPSNYMLPNDKLVLISNELPSPTEQTETKVQGLCSYGHFLKEINTSQEIDKFGIVLLQFSGLTENYPKIQQNIATKIITSFPKACVANYGNSAIVMYIPKVNIKKLEKNTSNLIKFCKDNFDCKLWAGISIYPFLQYSRNDILDNAKKALEHARMLEKTHVAVFDSISINIHADKLFNAGDFYNAVSEYKQALLANKTNILALNSLGVCYARISDFQKALSTFEEARKLDLSNTMTQYNYGYICQRLGNIAEAKLAFAKCIELDKSHIYSLCRLGMIAELEGDQKQAYEFYKTANKQNSKETAPLRYLAQLSLKQKSFEQAWEYLHQILRDNPRDAHAMNLLASLYLELKEDPQIAESLARKSVQIRPDIPKFWDCLIKTLEAQNKNEEANIARNRSTKI